MSIDHQPAYQSERLDAEPADIVDAVLVGIEDGDSIGLPETELQLLAARQELAKLREMRGTVSEFIDTSRKEKQEFQDFSGNIMEAVRLIVNLNSTMERLTNQMGPAITGSLASIPNIDSQITEKERILLHLEQFHRDLSILEAALRTKDNEIVITRQLIESRETGEGSTLPDISKIGKNACGIDDSHIIRAKERLPKLVQEREEISQEIENKVNLILNTAQIMETEASAYVADLDASHDNRVRIIDTTKAKAELALKELGQSVVKNSAVRGALLADPEARAELLSLPEVRQALMSDENAVRALLADETVVKVLLANPIAADALMARLLDQPLEITDK